MPTILVVDDDVALLASLAAQLEEAGYRVLRADDTASAERQARAERPDLLLLDVGMERGAGWGLLERLARDLSVLVISDKGLEEDIVRGLEAGAVDYMTKPFRSGELLARLRLRLRPPDAPSAAQGTTTQLVAEDALPHLQAAPPTIHLDPADDDDAEPLPAPRVLIRHLGEPDSGEPVFMTSREEQRLLREQQTASDLTPGDLEQLPLGQRLRAARQRRRITLVQAELERNKLRMHYIQAMEEEKFALLPRGALAEELLRTYAEYLGLDVAHAVDEYRRHHYNAPVEPPVALGGARPGRQLPPWVTLVTAVVLALAVGIGGIWLLDPSFAATLPDRVFAMVAPPTATPTATLTPTATTAPTATRTPTATLTPAPTATLAPPTATLTTTGALSPTATLAPSP